MYSSLNTKYGLCFFQNDELISFCELDTESEARELIIKNKDTKYLIFAWLNATETSKLVWMVDNGVSGDNRDSVFLAKVYSDLFSFGDSWRAEYS